MGLILSVVGSMYLGALCVLLAPSGFMQRPLAWLRAISHYRAEITASPELRATTCVSRGCAPTRWRASISPNGRSSWSAPSRSAPPRSTSSSRRSRRMASPRARSIPASAWPRRRCIVSMSPVGAGVDRRMLSRSALQANRIRDAADKDDAQALVGCGYPMLDRRLAIVDPHTLRRLPADTVGEIWIEGAHVAGAYWDNPQASDASLHARIEGEGGALAAQRRPRLSRCDGRAVHHRPHQGPHHHPRHQPLPAGHRAHRRDAPIRR